MDYKDIKDIVDSWDRANLSDIASIIGFRRDLSALYYQLSEHKALNEGAFLTHETERKNTFNTEKLNYIKGGNNVSVSITMAEASVKKLREKEVKAEREYKKSKDMLNSLDHILNAMSSAIKVGENEKRQGGYHV
jgi:hypothetical protein